MHEQNDRQVREKVVFRILYRKQAIKKIGNVTKEIIKEKRHQPDGIIGDEISISPQ